MNRRWYLSDVDRIVIYFALVVAVFLAAMALGWQNLWMLLVAAAVLAAAVVGVLTSAARPGAPRIATARVLSVSDPPPNTGIAARCDMVLEVMLPGLAPVRTRHRDPAIPLERWPQPGQTLPVEVRGGNPRRRLHIRWDLVNQGMVRAPGSSDSADSPAPAFIWEEENEPIVYSPTPPRSRRPSASSPPPSSPSPAAPPPAAPAAAPPPASTMTSPRPSDAETTVSPAEVVLHETFTDEEFPTPLAQAEPAPAGGPARQAPPDEDDRAEVGEDRTPTTATDRAPRSETDRPPRAEAERAPTAPAQRTPPREDDADPPVARETTRRDTPTPATVDEPRTDPNGHDPYGYDPADFETPRLTAEPPDPAPAVTGGPGFEAITLSDFDPADVDIRDFMDEPPAVTRMPPDEPDSEPSTPAATTPSPRTEASPAAGPAMPPAAAEPAAPKPATPPAERATPPVTTDRPTSPAGASATPTIPQPRDPGRTTTPGPGVSVTRPVADLDRALRFYRDVLGFSVLFTSAKSAVVERQGSRVLLDERGIQPTPGEIHLDVTDIEGVCASVRASAGEVVEAPAPVHDTPGLQLWRARLRDPDGHVVEVIEWRSSSD